jgi:hypothetical protein
VGEEVDVTYSGGNATWTATAGTLSPAAGATVRFTAPDTAQDVTITATGSCGKVTITFTIVAPSSYHMESLGGVQHTHNRPDIGMRAESYVLPDDVNFYNMETQELDIGAVATGVYACLAGTGHHPGGPATMSDNVVAGKGTKENSTDHVFSGDCGTPPPFAPGHIVFDIPNQYRVGGGAWHNFTPSHQECILAADASTLTADKAGAHADSTVGAPTTL